MRAERGAEAANRVGGSWRAVGIISCLARRAFLGHLRGDRRFTGARYAYPAISMEA